ncbi:hypothetical protein L0F63_001470, partial [Massospora cicadina]
MSSLEIESTDVIRLIQQFLKENNLLKTLDALRFEETGTTLNTVDSLDIFVQEIVSGQWDLVLKTVSGLKLPTKKLMDLYEQIVIELAELREISAARNFLRQTEPMYLLRETFPNRYIHLENLISKTYFDAREAYQNNGGTKEKRRLVIANSLSQELPKKQHAECGAFSPDGQYFVSGTTDGFVEVWNFMTGKLRKDLKYQAEGAPMLMEQAVLCVSFSRDSELLATGSHSGDIQVWRLHSGQPIKKFLGAHSQGVTSVSFGKDSTQVLSTSFDGLIRLHGLKSGKKIKEFRGHTSFVNSAVFSEDHTRVLSASSDGTIRIWDPKSTDCLTVISSQDLKLGIKANSLLSGVTFNQILRIPKSPDLFLVCSASNFIHVLNLTGKLVKTFTLPEKPVQADDHPNPTPRLSKEVFVSLATSSRGEYLYAFCQNGLIYSYSIESTQLIQTLKVTEKEPINCLHHPFSSLLATVADENCPPPENPEAYLMDGAPEWEVEEIVASRHLIDAFHHRFPQAARSQPQPTVAAMKLAPAHKNFSLAQAPGGNPHWEERVMSLGINPKDKAGRLEAQKVKLQAFPDLKNTLNQCWVREKYAQ